MVLSTEIPNAILNTKMVEAFIGISAKPIIAAVKTSGITFGINDIITILHDENINAIKPEISRIASARLVNKLFNKY